MIEALESTTIPPEDEALRPALRAFLREALGERAVEVRARSWAGFDADFSRALAARGWVGLTLPREYGGAGRSAFARFVAAEELLIAGAPVAAHWIADRQSGPLILKYGSEAQKRFYLPRICRGEAFFCIGMSEPGAGSDLAGVRTRAERHAQGWRLNGQKLWTTYAHEAHYMIALARTSGAPEARHAGLSQLVVDLSLPGITVRPVRDLAGGASFCEVFFDDVLLAEDALIGSEGHGWAQVTSELAFERSGPERIYSSIVLLEPWLAWLRALPAPSQEQLAQAGAIVAELAVLRQMSLALTSRLAAGGSPALEAALVKDLGTGFEQRLPAGIADTVHADPAQPPGEALCRTLDHLERIAPAFSLRGGTREVLRGMIAPGLGLR